MARPTILQQQDPKAGQAGLPRGLFLLIPQYGIRRQRKGTAVILSTFLDDIYAFAVARAPGPLAYLLRPKLLHQKMARAQRDKVERRRTVAEQGRDVKTAHFSWYRGEATNYNPTKLNLFERNAIDDYILKGWQPAAPFISKDTPVVAFGSCFAGHVSRYLRERGFNILGKGLRRNAYIIRFGEGMVNTFAIRQQFEWAFEGRGFNEGLWHDKGGELLRPEPEVREQTLDIFRSAEAFILTLGLSEVWYDKETGEVFWRAIPSDAFDPQRHGFRVSSVDENLDNLRAILRIIRTHRPEAKVIFTLSPVPLIATFRPVSCISANSVSKAVLRVAVDELMRENRADDRLFYFPSFEIVTGYFRDPYTRDNRHVRPRVVQTIMEAFARHYVTPRSIKE